MFKKFLQPSKATNTIFPLNSKLKESALTNHTQTSEVKIDAQHIRESLTSELKAIMSNTEFIQEVAKLVIPEILAQLLAKYDFTPTDKYLQQVAEKKKYIRQLDDYLAERKLINNNVETELQQFLQNTTDGIQQALVKFSQDIREKLLDAENKHGIDKIKKIISPVEEHKKQNDIANEDGSNDCAHQ